ncbi:MAG: DUF222 domain-containing protein [Acidimicrobiia bacterium]|nr:DUF222 domain-containing protein [Acidimicrobiia bacterium]
MAAAVGGVLDIRAATVALSETDVAGLCDDELAGFVVEVEALLNAVHALSSVALEVLERRGTWAAEGARSAAGWAAGRTGTPAPSLRARVRAGKALRMLPTAAEPARAGALSPDHLTALASCERRHPALAARDEDLLVGQAVELDAGAFRAAARHWEGCAADVDAPDALPGPEPVDEVYLSKTLDGRYILNGSFSEASGELLHAALGAEVDRKLRAARDGDPSFAGLVTSQLRAAAMVDLACQAMRREPSESSVPDRYRVAVIVPFDKYDDLGLAACDALAFRVVLGADGEVLDVGRESRRWSAPIRRAVTIRDSRCIFPGCDRPPSWCDIHHCEEWEHGGETSVGNGALLCRHHHTFVHKEHWRIAIEHGKPVTRWPDGTQHVIRRWDTTPPSHAPSNMPGAARKDYNTRDLRI